MKYKCLILDHDDTVVDSTPHIHYPSMAEALKTLRPKDETISLENFITYSFNPGFSSMCKDILKLSEEEIEFQYNIWKSHTKKKVPEFYSGFPELLKEWKRVGGIICVASHSEAEQIERDYRLSCGFAPDKIFGWELGEERRKPKPYPILETMRYFKIKKEDILVVDDLKPGLDMARSCNTDFAAAAWSHAIPMIRDYMKNHSDYYFESVMEFKKFIFEE